MFTICKHFIFNIIECQSVPINVSIMYNILKNKTLNEYAEKYPEASDSLKKWYYEFRNSDFKNSNELKEKYGNASILKDNRVVFNIHGNKYRLIVRINYTFKNVMIKWFGTHKEYDQIEAEKVVFIADKK